MDAQPTQQTPIESSRESFDVVFYKRVEEFSAKVIEEIPELHGMAIVPLWNAQPTDAPPGFLRLRDPQTPYLASLLQLLGRMAAFNVELHRDFVSQIKVFDNYALHLAEKIKEYTGKLEELQPKLPEDKPATNE